MELESWCRCWFRYLWFSCSFVLRGAVGHVGVEYNFWFPLQLSVDYRPNLGIVAGGGGAAGFNTTGLYSGITLGVRYLF